MKPTARFGVAEFAVFFAGLLLISSPTFFEIYRSNVFEVLPRDRYESMVLFFAGDGGGVLESPFGYRVLYPILGVVPYWLSPLISFSELNSTLSLNELRATQALALVSYLSMIVVAAFAYRICRERGELGQMGSIVVGLTSFFLLKLTAFYGVDPMTIAFICAGLFWVGNPLAFSAVLLIGFAANEKIALVFVIFFTSHALLTRQWSYLSRAGLAAIALLAYFAVRGIVALPGMEHQTDLAQYPPNFISSFDYLLNLKGLYMNGFGPALLISVWVAAARWTPCDRQSPFESAAAIVLILALFGIGMALGMEWTIGRLALHALPFFFVPLGRIVSLPRDNAATDGP